MGRVASDGQECRWVDTRELPDTGKDTASEQVFRRSASAVAGQRSRRRVALARGPFTVDNGGAR